MQFSLTPQTLAQMDNVPLQYTGRALDSLDRMGQADQLTLEDLANLNQHNAAMRPMLQEHQGLSNASLAVQIPGQAADAQIRARKNANEDLLNDDNIRSMRSKYKDEELTHHINQMSGLGSLMMGAAEQAWSAPLGGTLAAKQMFKDAGLENRWQPEWDNLRTDQLAMKLHEAGQQLVMTGSRAQQALQSAQLKGDMALERTRIQEANKSQIAAMQDATKRALAHDMMHWKTQFKVSTDQLIASLAMRMNAAQDPKLKEEYNRQIRYLQDVQEKIRTKPGATFAVGEDGKIHIVNSKEQTGTGAAPGAEQQRRGTGTADDPIVLK